MSNLSSLTNIDETFEKFFDEVNVVQATCGTAETLSPMEKYLLMKINSMQSLIDDARSKLKNFKGTQKPIALKVGQIIRIRSRNEHDAVESKGPILWTAPESHGKRYNVGCAMFDSKQRILGIVDENAFIVKFPCTAKSISGYVNVDDLELIEGE